MSYGSWGTVSHVVYFHFLVSFGFRRFRRSKKNCGLPWTGSTRSTLITQLGLQSCLLMHLVREHSHDTYSLSLSLSLQFIVSLTTRADSDFHNSWHDKCFPRPVWPTYRSQWWRERENFVVKENLCVLSITFRLSKSFDVCRLPRQLPRRTFVKVEEVVLKVMQPCVGVVRGDDFSDLFAKGRELKALIWSKLHVRQ